MVLTSAVVGRHWFAQVTVCVHVLLPMLDNDEVASLELRWCWAPLQAHEVDVDVVYHSGTSCLGRSTDLYGNVDEHTVSTVKYACRCFGRALIGAGLLV